MTTTINRREFLELAALAGAGIAGVVFASGLRPVSAAGRSAQGYEEGEFVFLQMSDTHWGFTGPAVNPDATVTLEKAVATVNGLERQPDFIVLDNVSDPTGSIGDAQLQWLRADLARLDRESPIVVLTHRPLFDLYPQWDWATRDGADAVQTLMPYEYVTVFYGHIHQEHHHMTGHIPHHSAKGLMFPLPAPGSVPKKAPIPWDPAHPYKGLGFRTVQAQAGGKEYPITEWPVTKG